MVRIRINIHPDYDYSNVMVHDHCENIREYVSRNQDDFIWFSKRPSTIMISGRRGKDRWGNLRKITSFCLDNKYEVKVRNEKNDDWTAINNIDDLESLIP